MLLVTYFSVIESVFKLNEYKRNLTIIKVATIPGNSLKLLESGHWKNEFSEIIITFLLKMFNSFDFSLLVHNSTKVK